MINPHPIYVANMQYGAGHYDTVIPVKDSGVNTVETLPPISTDVVKSSVEQTCNCGRKFSNGQFCVFSLFQYSCRCPCYNSKQSFKAKCRCKNCSNPFGVREKQAFNVGSKRERTSHANQKFLQQGKRTKTFMEAIGEPVSTGGFSDLEFLMSSTVHCVAVVEWDEIETQDVHTTYSAIIQLTRKMKLNIGLFERSVSDTKAYEELQS